MSGSDTTPSQPSNFSAMTDSFRAIGLKTRAGRRRPPLAEFGYSLGQSIKPRGVPLYARGDRSTRVIGPMGSGKTLMFMLPALRNAPGAALATSTKPDIYQLSYGARSKVGPVVALDPLRMAPSAPRLRWSPIIGAENSRIAEKRGRAFAAGAKGSSSSSDASMFYRRQAGTYLMCLFHAAALSGANLRDVLAWARRPQDPAPRHILQRHPLAAPGWADLLDQATSGDDRTVGNTRSTVAQALSPFDHEDVVREIDIAPGQDPTDLRQLIRDRGTAYVLGKDEQFSAVAPLLTAVVEDVLDAAEEVGYNCATSPRLDPWFLAVLDELALITPIPSLRQRIMDGRGRGIALIYAVQSWASMRERYGPEQSTELESITSNAIVFSGDKDPRYLADLEQLCGQVEVTKASTSTSGSALFGATNNSTTSYSTSWEPAVRAQEIARLPRTSRKAQVLVLAENLPPVISELRSLLDVPEWPAIKAEAKLAAAADEAARITATERRQERDSAATQQWDQIRTSLPSNLGGTS